MAVPDHILLAALAGTRGPIVLVTGAESNPPGQIVFVNPAFLSLTQYTEEDLLDRSANWLTRLADEETAVSQIRNAVDQTQPYTGEAVLRTRTGEKVPVEIDVTPLGTSGGSPTYYLGQVHTLEPRKELERHLWEAQRLAAVAQLTQGVTGQFERLAHALAGDADRDRASPSRGAVHEEIEATRHLIRQLLAFTLPSPPSVATIRLNHLVRDLECMVRSVLGPEIAVVLDLDENLGGVRGDKVRLQQVLINLVVNAREAMPAGGTLTITTANTYPADIASGPIIGKGGGVQVVLSVQDTGVGMSPAVRARIFEPFFTTKPQGFGMGLGLTSVHGIVKEAGGYVWVQSAEGSGTTVRLYLPYVSPP